MAEKVVSPGVFTNEKELSFLPQGIGEIGAAIIGPTVKGPAFVPTIIESFSDFERQFGGFNEKMYVPYTVKQYLKSAGRVTIVRVLGTAGYKLTAPVGIIASGSYGSKLVSFLHPTFVISTDGTTELFEGSSVPTGGAVGNQSGSFVFTLSGSAQTDTTAFTGNATNKIGTIYSASIAPSNANYVGDVFGKNPEGSEPAYNYVLFENFASKSLATTGVGDPATTVYLQSGSTSSEFDLTQAYQPAVTPWINSQNVNGTNRQNLFKVHSLSHGTAVNYEFKIGIQDIKPAGSVPGSEYGSFTLIVRAVDQDKIVGSPYGVVDDTDVRPNVLEVFSGLNLDPDSPNFINRKIGDKYITVDDEGKLSTNGDYANKSKYVRIEVVEAIKTGGLSVKLIPFGFRALVNPISSTWASCPSASYVSAQTVGGVYNKKVFHGFDYDFSGTDNLNYLKPLVVAAQQTTGSNADFYLGDSSQNSSANFPNATSPYTGSINLTTTQTGEASRKFLVPLQGGFDGFKPNVQRRTGTNILSTNTQGFDLSSATGTGYTAYRKAIKAVSNPLEFDINMMVVPGVLHELHSVITTLAKDTCEDRSDAFYVMDLGNITLGNNGMTEVTDVVSAVDSNYTATYHPWVKIIDTAKNKPIWVPPSVVLPGVIAFTDRVAHEWFAPAGLNRGGLTEVVEVYSRLTRDEMDSLYEGRVNPIATFPGQGAVVWGQKTLQAKPSALDRINVRRLLIATKKFIASATRFLVFENNTAQTRNKFLNIVNPYLESIQQRQGLYAFKVIMDESNNTPDIVDRNLMVGSIFLQPAKAAEFIVLDFNILPTGAAFPE